MLTQVSCSSFAFLSLLLFSMNRSMRPLEIIGDLLLQTLLEHLFQSKEIINNKLLKK